jgi:hypothetical protein
MTARAYAAPLRSLGFASISAAFAAVGTPSDRPIRAFSIINNTEGDMIFSDDNTVAEGKWFVAAGSFDKWDVQSNMNAQFDDKYVLPIGTQFYVKQVEAPESGSVYIEIFD